jgi:hypothetical protein
MVWTHQYRKRVSSSTRKVFPVQSTWSVHRQQRICSNFYVSQAGCAPLFRIRLNWQTRSCKCWAHRGLTTHSGPSRENISPHVFFPVTTGIQGYGLCGCVLLVEMSIKRYVFITYVCHLRKTNNFCKCCKQLILGYTSGVLDAKKTLTNPPLNYRLTVTTANFQNESRSHAQLNLLEPNLNSVNNFLKMTRTIYQLHTHVERSLS